VELDGEKKPRVKVPSSDTRVLPGVSGLPGTRWSSLDAHRCIKLNEQERNKRVAQMGEMERIGTLDLILAMEND